MQGRGKNGKIARKCDRGVTNEGEEQRREGGRHRWLPSPSSVRGG